MVVCKEGSISSSKGAGDPQSLATGEILVEDKDVNVVLTLSMATFQILN